mmetsp:Transcript_17534/g.48843  ORF Transcript_17534/g.48843 Transcript_17534/m.48843 type:complete len:660 (+) Transcript_17534:2749-4728(+)
MGGCALGEQQAHGVTLVAEGGLHANEDVAELLAKYQQLLTVGVQLPRGLAPVLLQVFRVLAQPLVLIHLHAVGDVEVCGVEAGLLVLQHALDQVTLVVGDITHIVALCLQLLQHTEDGAKHVQVSSSAHVTLVRGEGEDGHSQALLCILLLAQVGPLNGTGAQGGDAVGQGVALASVAVTASEHNGLHGTIQLGQGHLQSHLHRVHTQLTVQPLLSGLEHQGQGAQVGHVQGLQSLNSLGGILASRAAHQGKASQGHHAVHEGTVGAQGVIEELLHRGAEVQAASKHRDHLGTVGLQLSHNTGVVALIAGHQVAALQHQAHHGGLRGELNVLAGVIPVQVLLQVLVEGGGHWVPDASLREQLRIGGLHVGALQGWHVCLGGGDEQVLQVVSIATQPVLQRLHKVACILGLIAGQELEHLGQGAHQLQQALLKVVIVLAGRLDKVTDDGLALAQLSHGERAQLVQLHDRRHRREDEAGIQLLACGAHHRGDLLSQLLNENQGADEDVGSLHILLERLHVVGITELFQQVSHHLKADLIVLGVDVLHGVGQGGLVLGLKHHVHHLHAHAVALVLGHHPAQLGVGAGEQTRALRALVTHVYIHGLLLEGGGHGSVRALDMDDLALSQLACRGMLAGRDLAPGQLAARSQAPRDSPGQSVHHL